MEKPVDVTIENFGAAQNLIEFLTWGHYFAFLREGAPSTKGRRARLQVEDGDEGPHVFPLVGKRIDLPGMTLMPRDRGIEPLGCVVTDRDLYRAEQDTVYVFAAVPSSPINLKLMVECNGVLFTDGDLELTDGVGPDKIADFTSDEQILNTALRLIAHDGFLYIQENLYNTDRRLNIDPYAHDVSRGGSVVLPS